MLPSPPLTHVEVTKVLSVLSKRSNNTLKMAVTKIVVAATVTIVAVRPTPEYVVGMTVRVDARTWPGINKHGGVGTIKKIVKDTQRRTRLNQIYTWWYGKLGDKICHRRCNQ